MTNFEIHSPEIDLRIAKILHLKCTDQERSGHFLIEDSSGELRPFCPSLSSEDAIFAANRYIDGLLYSARQKFFYHLQESLRSASGMDGLPAWPDAVGLLFKYAPAAISEAILNMEKER